MSMTGYGMGSAAEGGRKVAVEIRTVNHRFLDVYTRLPKGYLQLEELVRERVSAKLSRGRVEVAITIEDFSEEGRTVKIDWGLVKGYEAALMELEKTLQIHYQARGEHILNQPDVLIAEHSEGETVAPLLESALEEALEHMLEMRAREGSALSKDLHRRWDALRGLARKLRERVPQIVAAYQERLRERIAELVGSVPLDEDRLALEVAVFADRCSISEELTRIDSHLDQAVSIMAQSGPVGRKLDFLIQELNREFNTIASKANDAAASQLVVDAKAELEKIREQVQNIE